MKVGILNVTGYAGIELARILARHPEVEVVAATGRSEAGKPLGEVFPHLEPLGLTVTPEITESVDLVFSALPHKASAEACAPFLEAGVKVVDISADFRLKSVSEYEQWYVPHPCPEYLEEAVYGLTELHRAEVAQARLVANPGCYPTSAVLALAPAVKAGIVEPRFIVDSKSGVSGAGRGLSLNTHYLGGQRECIGVQPGGASALSRDRAGAAGPGRGRAHRDIHPAPHSDDSGDSEHVLRGDQAGGAGIGGARGRGAAGALHRVLRGAPLCAGGGVAAGHQAHAGQQRLCGPPGAGRAGGRLVVVSCLDNLVKGAAGQAVQNMNVMWGLPEEQGLEALALYP